MKFAPRVPKTRSSTRGSQGAAAVPKEPFMSISSLSLTFVNCYATQAPAGVGAVQPAPAPAPAASDDACHDRPSGVRRNVLYEAMLSALRELGLTGGSPVPASGTPAPAAPADTATASAPSASTESPVAPAPALPAADPSPSVKDAVFNFADALFQAVRVGDGSQPGRERAAERAHHGHHGRGHAYGHRLHRDQDAYAGLAQRLETLATSLSPTNAAAPAVAPDPVAPVAPEAPSAPAAPSATEAPAVPETAATPDTSATPATAPTSATSATPAPSQTSNPLVDAFNRLLTALQLPIAAGSDTASRLSSFLHQLAQALQPTPAAAPPATVGMLINETA
jgi:hypothetical protein